MTRTFSLTLLPAAARALVRLERGWPWRYLRTFQAIYVVDE